jgi:DNA repair protein RadB
MQLACATALAGGKVLLLDSEGASPERLAQLAGEDLDRVRAAMLVSPVHTPEEQARAMARAARIVRAAAEVRLVLVDSATLLYRVQLADGDGLVPRRALLRQLHGLHAAARARGCAVLLTNQVFAEPGEDGVRGLGGHGLRHLAGTVLRLERLPTPGARSAVLVKHRSRPEGLRCAFAIGPHGLAALDVPTSRRAGFEQIQTASKSHI